MKFIINFLIIGLFLTLNGLMSMELKRSGTDYDISKPIRTDKKLGFALYGSSSVGTNLVEYNVLSQVAVGVGLGLKEGYDPTSFDKIKISSKYYFLKNSFSPCGVVGFVFRENLTKFDSINFPYFGLGSQYLANNGLGLSFEVDYFKTGDDHNVKPSMAIYWFF